MRCILSLALGCFALLWVPSACAEEAPPPSTIPADAPLVYEHLRNSYYFEADGTGYIDSEQRIRIQNEIAIQQLGQLFFPYVKGRDRLEIEYLRVRKPDGSVTDAEPELLQDRPLPVTAMFPIYSDTRMLHATVPAFRPGDVVELRITNHLEQPDAPDRFWMMHFFTQEGPVLEEILEVDLPAEQPIHLRIGEGFEAEVTSQGERRKYRWTHRNTSDAETVSVDPDTEQTLQPDIELSSFRDWEQVGAWYGALEADRVEPDAAIRRKAKELIEGLDDDTEKIRRLYEYVAKEFRYLGLLLGSSRYQPNPAPEVFTNGYGDCKDKHTLLSALLAAAGYRSAPVLISSYSEVTEEVPSPQKFDHVITAVPLGDDLLFMDSTVIAPFGYLDAQLRGKQALMIPRGEEARLVETPDALPFPSQMNFSFDGETDTTGTLKARIELDYRGDEEHLLRMLLLSMPATQWGELVTGLSQEISAGDVEDPVVGDLTAIDEPLKVTYTLSRPGYLQAYSKEQQIDLPLPQIILPEVPDATAATTAKPLQLGGEKVSTRQLSMTLPERFEVTLPVAVSLDRDFASYHSSYEVDGSKVRVEETITIKQLEVPPGRLREYEAFRRSVNKARKQKILLRSSGADEAIATSDDVDTLLQAGDQAANDEDFSTAAALFSRVVEIEPEHERAWLELGRALVRTDQAAKGAEAVRRQIEIDPYNDRAYRILGWALEKTGDTDGALAAYRSQLEQHPLDHYANRRLGMLLAQQDDCGDDAMKYLRNALTIKQDDSTSRAALGACYLDLGQTEEGLETLEPLLESATDNRLLGNAGHAALRTGQLEAAIAFFTRATELDETDEDSFLRLADAYRQQSQEGKANEILQQLTRDRPDSLHAFMALGQALVGAAKWEEAEHAFRRAAEIQPDYADAHLSVASLLVRKLDVTGALEAYRRALAARPGDGVAIGGLASALAVNGQVDEAISTLRPFVEDNPHASEHLTLLGSLLFAKGEFEEAFDVSRKVLALNPDDPPANHTVGMVLSRQGKYAEALVHLEKSKAGAPNDFPDQDVLDYVRQQVEGGEGN